MQVFTDYKHVAADMCGLHHNAGGTSHYKLRRWEKLLSQASIPLLDGATLELLPHMSAGVQSLLQRNAAMLAKSFQVRSDMVLE